MALESELVTVYRSADPDAEEQANAALDLLRQAGLRAELFDDQDPGVPIGAYEVRVPPSQVREAERLIEAPQPEPLLGPVDPSHDLDMAPVFASDAHNAEMLAIEVRNVLEAFGIPAVLVGSAQIPSLPVEVRVPKARLEEARQVLAEAEASGPAAAEEAERQSEEEII